MDYVVNVIAYQSYIKCQADLDSYGGLVEKKWATNATERSKYTYNALNKNVNYQKYRQKTANTEFEHKNNFQQHSVAINGEERRF